MSDITKKYLIDALIDYADANNLPVERAASILSELAKQRIPERNLEIDNLKSKSKLQTEISGSRKEYFIARVIMVTRVHSIAWTYYPEYHVIGSPWPYSRFHAGPWQEVSWKPQHREEDYYVDDLFLDPAEWQFWMPEPYLSGLPICQKLYSILSDKSADVLKGTNYKKIDPELVREFKELRDGKHSFEIKECEEGKLYRRSRYGSKGWRERISFLPSWAKTKWRNGA